MFMLHPWKLIREPKGHVKDKPEPKIYLPQSPKDPPASPKAKPMAGRHKENILS
jgi:hypothetical protein